MKKTVTLSVEEWENVLSVLHLATMDSSDYDENEKELIDDVYTKLKDELN